MDAIRAAGRDFFELPDGEKEKVAISNSEAHRGFAKKGAEQIDPDGPQDYRETFLAGWEPRGGGQLPARIPLLGPNQWPNHDDEFRTTLNAYYDAVMAVAMRLLECISHAILPGSDLFSEMFETPLTNLVLAHYPILEGAPDHAVLGCGEHTDYGLITLLLHDGVPGLQVQARNGDWLDAESAQDDLIVNIGDMLEFMTGGRYVSNKHRVMVMRTSPRLSIPFFVQPDYDAIIRPVLEPVVEPENRSRWKPRLGGAYIEERFAETFPGRLQKLLQKLRGADREAVKDCATVLQILADADEDE